MDGLADRCSAAGGLLLEPGMNSGWVQFGYRFSLDYIVFLTMLLAIGGRPLTKLAKLLIVVGIAINLFGAVTFDRDWKYYRLGGNTYDVVVPH